MSIPTDGLVQITLEQSLFGASVANVFYYWDSTNAAITDMAGIGAAFNVMVVDELALVQLLSLQYDAVIVRDILGLNPDVSVSPSQADGDVTGEGTSPFVAVAIDLLVSSKITRRGFKRFAGQAESQVNSGQLVTAALTAWNTLAGFLDNTLSVGGKTYTPVVRGLPTPTDATRNVVNTITGTFVHTNLSHQTPRKRA